MGICLGKFHYGGRSDVQDLSAVPPAAVVASPTSGSSPSKELTAKSKNHVAPHPAVSQKASESALAPASPSRPGMPLRDDSTVSTKSTKTSDAGGPPRLQRSQTATARSTNKRNTFALVGNSADASSFLAAIPGINAAGAAGAAASTTAVGSLSTASSRSPPRQAPTGSAPVVKQRLKSVRPEFQRTKSTMRDDQSIKRARKAVNVTLDVLLKDERARLGFFKYLEATSLEESMKDGGIPDPIAAVNEHAKLRRRASKLTQARMTIDYREDCVLFWLEISDLLKIPSGGSFQLGLMQDLFDVYVTKGAPRLLPMVSTAEREPLAQYLQDRNIDRALLSYKMLLLDVLEIVTASFDEYVRDDGKLGYVQATKSVSMRNVLARIAHVSVGPASNDRRGQLNDLLNTPTLCRMFREFLQERNSVENLLFIIDALAFEDLVNTFERESDSSDADQTSRHDYCLRQAQKIFNKYIRYGSKAEICLGATVKENLLHAIVEYPLGAQVFNDAVLLCSAELVHSHLDMFYRSHAYLQFQLAKTQAERAALATTQSGLRRRSASTISRRQSAQAGTGADDATASNEPSLAEILNSVGVNFFRDFLKEEGVENMLLFYKEVEQFQLLPHGQKHYIQSKARKIFDRFVRRGGKLEIELPMDVRRDILFKLSSPSEYTFVDALKFVVNMWEHRYLHKFRAHKLYKEMLPAMVSAPPSIAPLSTVDAAMRKEVVLPGGVAVSGGNSSSTNGSTATSSTALSSQLGGDWVDVTKINLREFLDLEFLRRYFRRFLEKEQCVNELHFYFEIANFQQLPTSDYLTRQAKKLYNRFCDPQSRECVMLRDDLRLELQQSLQNPSPAMFKKTQEEIFTFFQSTLFPKFQQSEIYRTIQMTHNQLRASKQAAMGGAGVDSSSTEAPRGGRFNFLSSSGGNGNGHDGGSRTDSNGATRPGTVSSPHRTRNSVTQAPAIVELAEEDVSVTLILENQETRALFLFFAEEIFCTESIYFWLDCNEYKDIPHRNYLKLRAQKIYRKYISGRAKLQVNLDSTIIKEIMKTLDDPARTLFLPAQRSITKMLERDTLPKFRKSKHFQPCLQILRAAANPKP